MNLQSIKDLLARARERFSDANDHHSIIADIIATELGVSRDSFSVRFKETTVIVKAHPVIKSELFLHKEKILTLISSRFGPMRITTIQ